MYTYVYMYIYIYTHYTTHIYIYIYTHISHSRAGLLLLAEGGDAENEPGRKAIYNIVYSTIILGYIIIL